MADEKKETSKKMQSNADEKGKVTSVKVGKDGSTITTTEFRQPSGKLKMKKNEVKRPDGMKTSTCSYYRKDGKLIDREVTFGNYLYNGKPHNNEFKTATFYHYTKDGVLKKSRTVNTVADYDKLLKNRNDKTVKCDVIEYKADGKTVAQVQKGTKPRIYPKGMKDFTR